MATRLHKPRQSGKPQSAGPKRPESLSSEQKVAHVALAAAQQWISTRKAKEKALRVEADAGSTLKDRAESQDRLKESEGQFAQAEREVLDLTPEEWLAWEASQQHDNLLIDVFALAAEATVPGQKEKNAREWIENFAQTTAGALIFEKLAPKNAHSIGHFFFLASIWLSQQAREADFGAHHRSPKAIDWFSAISWLRSKTDAKTWREGLSNKWAQEGALRAAHWITNIQGHGHEGAWSETQGREAHAALRALKEGGVDFWARSNHDRFRGNISVWAGLAEKAPALIGWLDGAGDIGKTVGSGYMHGETLLERGLRHPQGAASFEWEPPADWAGREAWKKAVDAAPRVANGALAGLKMDAWRSVLRAQPTTQSDEDSHSYSFLVSDAKEEMVNKGSREGRLMRGAAIRLWIEWGGARPEWAPSDENLASVLSVEDARALGEKGLVDFSRPYFERPYIKKQSPLRELYEKAKKSDAAPRRGTRDRDPSLLNPEIEIALEAMVAAGARDDQPDADGNLLLHEALGDRSLAFAAALAETGATDLSALNKRGRGVVEIALSSLVTHKDPRAKSMLASLAQKAFPVLPDLSDASEQRVIDWFEKNKEKLAAFPQLIASAERLELARATREARAGRPALDDANARSAQSAEAASIAQEGVKTQLRRSSKRI